MVKTESPARIGRPRDPGKDEAVLLCSSHTAGRSRVPADDHFGDCQDCRCQYAGHLPSLAVTGSPESKKQCMDQADIRCLGRPVICGWSDGVGAHLPGSRCPTRGAGRSSSPAC